MTKKLTLTIFTTFLTFTNKTDFYQIQIVFDLKDLMM